ncbi:hypothetical protein QYF36_018709 [Acer negundo]|nr:hypothetical protein QYF36_018709 [Acer negundo]
MLILPDLTRPDLTGCHQRLLISSEEEIRKPIRVLKKPILTERTRMSNNGENFSQFDISKEEIEKLVSEVVRYVMFKNHQNSGCPIKREELVQLVTKNYNQRSLPAFVINAAKEKLSSVFGYELRELQRPRPSSTNQGRASQKNSVSDARSYILKSEISEQRPEVHKKFVEDPNAEPLAGFTFVILSIVQLAGGKIAEENVWHHLKRMGLSESDTNHPVLGNVKQALETLVQQRYLQKDKVSGPEGNILFYELAERALDGPVNQKIKDYISQIVKKDPVPVDVD